MFVCGRVRVGAASVREAHAPGSGACWPDAQQKHCVMFLVGCLVGVQEGFLAPGLDLKQLNNMILEA